MNIPYFFQVTDLNQEKNHEVLKTLLKMPVVGRGNFLSNLHEECRFML
jgi:hypothetical protein